MQKIFGDYIEEFSPELDSLELTFTPNTRCIRQRWSNNRLSAQFIGDYFSAFIPTQSNDRYSDRRIKESKSAVGYVANELLENAMKFSDYSRKFKVRFGVYFLEDPSPKNSQITAVLYVTNSTTAENAEKFQGFLTQLLASDPEELYVSQVEKSLEEDSNASGLGFLTMINDYSAKLGWKFATINTESPIITVTSMAQITV
ncbi:MAG: ATP-binding protein [Cyanobacteria bacterium P01_A01_bin.83]